MLFAAAVRAGSGHNAAKRQTELRGYRCDIGVDGLPTDPNYPFNRAG